MKNLIRVLSVATVLALSPAATFASHIFSTNITIDGTAVAAGGAFTDPTIVTTVGTNVTFSFDLLGGFADTFFVSISDGGGSTLPTPAGDSFAYNGTGTAATPVVFSFTRSFAATGLFDGVLIPDFPVSFPDYIFPNGSQASEPRIPFTIEVRRGVPEPASMALVVLGLAGLAVRLRTRA